MKISYNCGNLKPLKKFRSSLNSKFMPAWCFNLLYSVIEFFKGGYSRILSIYDIEGILLLR